jgi:hypothetical protein
LAAEQIDEQNTKTKSPRLVAMRLKLIVLFPGFNLNISLSRHTYGPDTSLSR